MWASQLHYPVESVKRQWSKGRGKASADEIDAHPERFILLCANCHFEEHDRIDTEKRRYAACLYCGNRFEPHTCKVGEGRDIYCNRQCQHRHRAELAKTP